MDDLIQRIEAAEGAETADLLYEAWNTLAQSDADFRRFACTVIDQRTGKTNAGRFAELLEVGAYLDAALTLVPEGCEWIVEAYTSNGVKAEHVRASAWVFGAPRCFAATPALALCAAALRAKESSDGE